MSIQNNFSILKFNKFRFLFLYIFKKKSFSLSFESMEKTSWVIGVITLRMKFLKYVEKSFMVIELLTQLAIVKTSMLSFVKT